MTNKMTIEQVDVSSRRVLMRVDFNVPMQDGKVTDDRRISKALPSIKSVIERNGRLILISHLGRPAGTGYEPSQSLQAAAKRLGELLESATVQFPSHDCTDSNAASAVESMGDGEIVVLENLRFHPEEKKGDPDFAEKLARYGDIYCNDAFGSAHRNDASMVALPKAMDGKPRVAGLLLQKELDYLADAITAPEKPFVAVLGGAKVSDKLGAISNLLGTVDQILIGGAMSYTFLKVLGHSVGDSLVENDKLDDAGSTIDHAAASTTDLILPGDHVCGREISSNTEIKVFAENIDAGWKGLDIGPETTSQYNHILHEAKTIVWNGPMGVFETDPFDVGTRQVAEAAVQATCNGATTIIGGGDTASAVERFGLSEAFTHISTGGGASVQMLEGKKFQSVECLDDA